MTRWLHPPELERQRVRAPFDPIVEGARHGLSRELSLAIWKRVCWETTDADGRHDAEQARRRFHEIAAVMAAHGGRAVPDVGRVTRAGTELHGEPPRMFGARELMIPTPGRVTLVATEARRWKQIDGEPATTTEQARRHAELPGAGDVARAMAVLQLPPRPDQVASPEASRGARTSRLFDLDLSELPLHREISAPISPANPVAKDGAIHVRAGVYQPGSPEADSLIARELVHAAQQRAGGGRSSPVPESTSPASQRSAPAAERMLRGIARLRGLAQTIHSAGPAELSALAKRVPGLARTAARVDSLTAGLASQALASSWRSLERFAGNAPAAMRSAAAAATPAAIDPAASGLSPSGGVPLAPELAARMAALFGRDLTHVRVHTGAAAAATAQALSAHAVTIGSHILFADGQFAPGTRAGDRLLLHELTHVIQHDTGRLPTRGGDGLRVSDPGDPEEVEARAAEDLADRAPRATPATHASSVPAPVGATQSTSAAMPAAPSADVGARHPREAAPREPTVGGQASRSIGGVLQSGAAFIVRRVSPGLADLIQRGPTAMLRQAIQPAISSWVGSITRGVNLREVAGQLTSSFATAFDVLQQARAGDPKCCDTLVSGINAIRELGTAITHNPAVTTLRSVIGQIGGVVSQVLRVVLAPAFDVVRGIVGGVWTAVSGIASTIAGWVRAVRDVASSAADWVAHQLGFPSSSGEDGLGHWLQQQASQLWNDIKETLRPAAAPLMAIGGVLVAMSPLGPLLAVAVVVPRLVRAAEWLWAHRSDPHIIRSAHAEMGHTILPQILEAGQSFVGALRSGATWLVNQVVSLGSGLLNLLGAISGVPLLSMAHSFVQDLQQHVQSLITWGQAQLSTAVTACNDVFTKVRNFIRPYSEVLCSIGLAIANPAAIPVILAGWAWRWLPDCIKPPIVDLLLDTVLGVLGALPIVPMFGVLWPILKNFVIGMLRAFRNRTPSEKIALTNKLARIISGASPEFLIGFVTGVLKGVWDGIKQPFEAIWMLAEGLTTVVEYFQRLAGAQTWQPRTAAAAPAAATPAAVTPAATAPSTAAPRPAATAPTTAPMTSSATPTVGIPALTPENIRGAVSGVAGQLVTQHREQQRQQQTARPAGAAPSTATLAPASHPGTAPATPDARAAEMRHVAGEAGQMAGQLAGPVGDVATNFWPAVQQLFHSGGAHMSFDTFVSQMSAIWEAAQAGLQSLGGQLANMIIDFFLHDSIERQVGEGVGYIVGMFAFQALLDYISAGTWTGAMQVVQQIARFLNWPNAALGEAMKLLARLGRYLIDGVRSLGRMISSAGAGALSRVLGAFTRIGELLGSFAERLLGRGAAAGEGTAVHAAEGAAAHTAEGAVAHTAEGAAAHTGEGTAAHAAESEAVAAEREAAAAEREAAAASREALKSAEFPEAVATARAIMTAAQLGHVPAALAALSLDGLKSRFTWIIRFEARGSGHLKEMYMIASDWPLGPYDDEEGVPNLGRGQILQTGGNTIQRSTAQALNEAFEKSLQPREWGRALEALKRDLGLRNDFHGAIDAAGNLIDPETSQILGNLGDYLP